MQPLCFAASQFLKASVTAARANTSAASPTLPGIVTVALGSVASTSWVELSRMLVDSMLTTWKPLIVWISPGFAPAGGSTPSTVIGPAWLGRVMCIVVDGISILHDG